MHFNFWLAALLAALLVAAFGAVVERLLLRQLPGQQLAQVLVTLGISFMAADFCLFVWGGDPINVTTPDVLAGFVRAGPPSFPFIGSPSSASPWCSRSRCGFCSTARGSAP